MVDGAMVDGATGVSGRLAVQIAKRLGATKVIATGHDADLLARLRIVGRRHRDRAGAAAGCARPCLRGAARTRRGCRARRPVGCECRVDPGRRGSRGTRGRADPFRADRCGFGAAVRRAARTSRCRARPRARRRSNASAAAWTAFRSSDRAMRSVRVGGHDAVRSRAAGGSPAANRRLPGPRRGFAARRLQEAGMSVDASTARTGDPCGDASHRPRSASLGRGRDATAAPSVDRHRHRTCRRRSPRRRRADEGRRAGCNRAEPMSPDRSSARQADQRRRTGRPAMTRPTIVTAATAPRSDSGAMPSSPA